MRLSNTVVSERQRLRILNIDVESRSACNLRRSGAAVYWEHPSTALWLASWTFDDEPIRRWHPGEFCPDAIREHVESGGLVSGWNVGFERLAWEHALGPTHGWPVPKPEQYTDTAALGAAMGLPRSLGDAGAALGASDQKDKAGYSLMMQMARPRRTHKNKNGGPDWYDWWDDEDRIKRLGAYCDDDVRAERAIRNRLVPLSDKERQVWLLDAKINARGVQMDVDLAHAMLDLVNQEQKRLGAEMMEATFGAISSATKVRDIKRLLSDYYSNSMTTLAKSAIIKALADPHVDVESKRILEIRQEAAKASTAKIKAAIECSCADGRARGLLLYHAASTGRWAGKLFQPQNLPRGTGTVKNPDIAIEVLRTRDAEWVRTFYGEKVRILNVISDCIRAIIMAAPGKDLIAADFSSIEGRVTAWLSGEAWKLDAYRANDTTIGHDEEGKPIKAGPGLYEVAGSAITGLPVKVIHKEHFARQLGKVSELALGFGGGVFAFYSMSLNYPDANIEGAYVSLWAAADDDLREKTEQRWLRAERRGDQGAAVMSREAWCASEITKKLWRKKHPATVKAWAALEDAARNAVVNKGEVFPALDGKVAFVFRKSFLWMRLPSGRCLAYAMPKVNPQVWVRHRTEIVDPATGKLTFDTDSEIMPQAQAEALRERGMLLVEGTAKAAVTALGVDSRTRKWTRFNLYSGLIMENLVQGTARDIMADGMLKAEAAGYPIVLTVHDEIVAEPVEGFGSLAEFEAMLCDLEPEYEGLPMTAEGWRGKRYKK